MWISSQTTFVVIVFVVVYAGMFLGGLPRLLLVSNVPAMMLLLPVAAGAHAGPTLALVSTFAGNLIIVGSIANIIVVNAAKRQGIEIDWRRHARIGVPVTIVTLATTGVWIWILSLGAPGL